MKRKVFKSNFLIPKTNFIVGAGSALNISGRYFKSHYSQNDAEIDLKAIECDWGVIGQDIKDTWSKFKNNVESETSANE